MRITRSILVIMAALSATIVVAQEASKVSPQAPPDVSVGQQIEWEGWSLKWQFRDVEGLVLTDVHFQGRKVLKYLGLAEIHVPYAPGKPSPEDFALGGFRANPMPLELGRDCYAAGTECRAFNRDGQRATERTADVMIHEESTGFSYAGKRGRATGKMFVLWSMVHFPGPNDGVNDDGYTYVIRWKLRNDGSLCAEVGSTGGLQHLNVGLETGRGMIVGKDGAGSEVFALSHVHNFYFRIDFDIDGAEGNVAQEFSYESDSSAPTMAKAIWRPFVRERGRLTNEGTFRSWRVVNPKSLNAQGHPRSYQLMPGSSGAWRDGGPFQVLRGDFFVTKYRFDEFPYTSSDSRRTLAALGAYLNDEVIQGTDVVIWYRLGFVHHPRSEDWQAQPIIWHSFELMPRDFLDSSPLKTSK